MMINIFVANPSVLWTKEQYQAVKTTCVLDVPFPQNIESFVDCMKKTYNPGDVKFLVEGEQGEVYALTYLLQRTGFLVYYRKPDGVEIERYPQPFVGQHAKSSRSPLYGYTVHVDSTKQRVKLRAPSGKLHTVAVSETLWENTKNPVVFAGHVDAGFLLVLADGAVLWFEEYGEKNDLFSLEEKIRFGVEPKHVTLVKATWLFSVVKIVFHCQDDLCGSYNRTVMVKIMRIPQDNKYSMEVEYSD